MNKRTGSRIALFTVGAVVGLAAVAALGAAGTGLWAHTSKRDGSGFYTTHAHRYATDTSALATAKVDVAGDVPDWVFDKFRIRVEPADGRRIFVGVGRSDDVTRYLAGVAHAEVSDVDLDPFDATYVSRRGTRSATPPASRTFWDASASGKGVQDLVWKPHKGDWSVVVMNTDGSAGVAADVSVAAKAQLVLWASIGAAVLGLALGALAALLIWLGARRPPQPPAVPAAVPVTP